MTKKSEIVMSAIHIFSSRQKQQCWRLLDLNIFYSVFTSILNSASVFIDDSDTSIS